MDLIGPLPESQGKNAILVIVDRFSKQVHVIPTTVTLSAEETARLLSIIYSDYMEYPKRLSPTRKPSSTLS